MAILESDKMSGSEFKAAINTKALDLSNTEKQTMQGSLQVGSLIFNTNGSIVCKNLESIGEDFSIEILNGPIIFKDNAIKITNNTTNILYTIGKANDNSLEIKIQEDLTDVYSETTNFITSGKLQSGNLRMDFYPSDSSVKYSSKWFGFGNAKDVSGVLNKNGLVLTALNGDDVYSVLYIYPPKTVMYETDGAYNELKHSVMLARRGALATSDIDSLNHDYYLWGDHNPYFHPVSTSESSGAIWIDYDESTNGYQSTIGPKGHQGILTDLGGKKTNAICLRSINKGIKYVTDSSNYSTLYVFSPKNANNEKTDFSRRVCLQTEGENFYNIYGEHNMKVVAYTPTNDSLHNIKTEFDVNFDPNIIECIRFDSSVDYYTKDVWIKGKGKWKFGRSETMKVYDKDNNESTSSAISISCDKNYTYLFKFYA